MKSFKGLRVNLLKEAVKRMEELTAGAILDGNTHTHSCMLARAYISEHNPYSKLGSAREFEYELNACLRECSQHRSTQPKRGDNH